MKILFMIKNKEWKIPVPIFILSFFLRFSSSKEKKLSKKAVRDIICGIKKYKELYGSFVFLEVEENGLQLFKIVI